MTPTPIPVSQETVLDYVRVLGYPVGTAANLTSMVICESTGMGGGACYNVTSLLVCAAAGFYGWTRKDWLGYALMAGSGAAALFIVGDMFRPAMTNQIPATPGAANAIAPGEPSPQREGDANA